MANTQQKTWLIVGCSSGFGLELAQLALARGDKVIATSRNASRLTNLSKDGAEAINLDVTHSDDKIKQSIDDAVAKVGGRLDILVNNAGYVLMGAVGECSTEEVRAQFETNVFGQLKVLAAVLPIMRKQRAGTIANIGSVGGWSSSPFAGAYCATKFAVAAFTQSVREENADFGIETTVIEPGYFRTDLISNVVMAERYDDDLKAVSEKTRAGIEAINHKQPGDPKKGAAVMIEALTKTGPFEGKALPLRLLLGSDAWAYVRNSIKQGTSDLEQWSEVTSKTDCDDV